jgi:hypothetical protein
LAARLRRAAESRKVLRILVDFCRWQLAGDAAAVMMRHRRTGAWSVVARSGDGLSSADAELFEEPDARDPPDRLHRIARPVRPHGRLFGGVVVRRRDPVFELIDASRLGRLCRAASAELEHRHRTDLELAVHRLYRKLARGVGAVDAAYHGLDEICRLTAADHSATVLLRSRVDRWRVCAEKLAHGPSRRIGEVVDPRSEPDTEAFTLRLDGATRIGRQFLITARASGGDPFDVWDREVVESLSDPIGAAIDRCESVAKTTEQ